jgi:hypothetical protein
VLLIKFCDGNNANTQPLCAIPHRTKTAIHRYHNQSYISASFLENNHANQNA